MEDKRENGPQVVYRWRWSGRPWRMENWGDVGVELNLCRTRILGTLSNHSHLGITRMEGKFRGDRQPSPKGAQQLTLSVGKAHIAGMISFNAHIRIQKTQIQDFYGCHPRSDNAVQHEHSTRVLVQHLSTSICDERTTTSLLYQYSKASCIILFKVV